MYCCVFVHSIGDALPSLNLFETWEEASVFFLETNKREGYKATLPLGIGGIYLPKEDGSLFEVVSEAPH